MGMVYCRGCGKEIHETATFCPHCGAVQSTAAEKSMIVALVLCFFFGFWGAHRFYAGKTGTGILMLFTCGGFLIWALIDFFVIASGNFTDSSGKRLK